jgi:Zn-dependent peptidase ImmA (M78 family)
MKSFNELQEIIEAKKIITHYGYSVDSIPVNVKHILIDKGIIVKDMDLPNGISGVLDTRGKKPLVLINSTHSENRQRFSMAHELGHFLLQTSFTGVHMDKATYFRSNLSAEGTDIDEKKANRFAAELLIPTNILLVKLQEYPDLIDSDDDSPIQDLANDFMVSTAALMFKLSGVLKGQK